MGSSIQETKLTCHVHSTSLPSVSHPLTADTEELLERLKASKSASSSSSYESICQNLSSLVDLCDTVDDVIQLSSSQQAFSCETSQAKFLDGSVRLLDLCATIREVFSQTKQSVQDLVSSIRRKRGGSDTGFSNDVAAYLTSKKKMNKLILNLKRMEKNCTTSLSGKGSTEMVLVTLLRDVEGVSLTMFDSILSFISQPKGRSKSKSSSFVSKLLQWKRVSSVQESDVSEVEKLDSELIIISSKKSSNSQQLHSVLRKLHTLDMNIQRFEKDLEALFRR